MDCQPQQYTEYFNTSHVSINLHQLVHEPVHDRYFNTSHVSINHHFKLLILYWSQHFNTSHVSINLIHILPFWNAYRISIHLMFLLIAAAAPSDNTTTVISIHLMFLLIRYPIRSRWIRNIYFNTSHVSINRVMRGQTVQNYLHFNTSHVSINPDQRAQHGCSSRYFNTSHVSINQNELEKNQITMEFQYVSCFY